MLNKVLLDNSIISYYRKFPVSGVHSIPEELQKIIDEGDNPHRGGKRKANAATSESFKVNKRAKKPTQILRSPSPVIQEESKETNVTFPPSSSIPTSDIFYTILRRPFLNVTTTPPSPPVTPPTLPMTPSHITSTIPISSTPHLPPTSFVVISLPHISIPLSSPIFTDSTNPTTSSISTPPKVLIVESVSEETRTSGIPVNTSDVGTHVNIGMTSEQPSSYVTPHFWL
ncbi:unnamed protein product [Lactuca saligna]|uniref:Uncharacterized protein n=1 Tax=Lactuca saligna TaxID=75948 RepID=A0AA35ZWQ4_LACSI|nr:unnamed protein product [Lactuca saligna]